MRSAEYYLVPCLRILQSSGTRSGSKSKIKNQSAALSTLNFPDASGCSFLIQREKPPFLFRIRSALRSCRATVLWLLLSFGQVQGNSLQPDNNKPKTRRVSIFNMKIAVGIENRFGTWFASTPSWAILSGVRCSIVISTRVCA